MTYGSKGQEGACEHQNQHHEVQELDLLEHLLEHSPVSEVLVLGVLNRLQKLAHGIHLVPLVPADHLGSRNNLADRLHLLLAPESVESVFKLEHFLVVHFTGPRASCFKSILLNPCKNLKPLFSGFGVWGLGFGEIGRAHV